MSTKITIGFNQVLTSGHMTGGRRREVVLLPSLLHEIQRIGFNSVVYVARNASDEQCSALVGDAPCRIVRTPIPTMPTWKRVLAGIRYWKKQCLADQLNLFHGLYYPLPKLPLPTVFTVHDLRYLHFPETYPFARRQFLKWAVPLTIHRANRIIAVSQDTKNDLINFYQLSPGKIHVAYNNIAPEFSEFGKDSGHLALSKYGLRQGYILYVGTLEPRKNLERLVEAYNKSRTNVGFKNQLVIVGKPNFAFKNTMNAIAGSPYSSDIKFTGFVDDEDLPSIYRSAAFLAFPSLHEGFGIPILESWNACVPCLTSNVSAMPEIAGDACHLVDPYCVESIAAGITKLLSDDDYCNTLVKAGKKRSALFSIKQTVDATMACYKSVINEKLDSSKGSP